MKLSGWDKQLGLASPLKRAAIHGGQTKNPSKNEVGLDVSHQTRTSPEGRGKYFFLDILFHRMSVNAMLRQLERDWCCAPAGRSDSLPEQSRAFVPAEATTMASHKGILLAVLLCCVMLLSLPASTQTTEPETGFWVSDGYGLLVEVSKDGLQAFELTSISCIPGWSATRDSRLKDVFAGNATFHLYDGASGDMKRLHLDGAASDILLRRTSALPARCAAKPDNTPDGNYAMLWQTFAEQYAFFDLRHIDWQSVNRQFRPKVAPATKPEELFDIFRQMIEPLQDAHTGIEAEDIKKEFDGWRNDPNHLEKADWSKAQQVIETSYVRGGLRSFCNGRVQFGKLDHSIGYLRVTAFYGYTDSDNYEMALRELQAALDEVFRDASKFNGLVIDVRLNRGGDDPLGIEIASRLTSRKYLAYSKVARNNAEGTLHFTDPQESWVTPSTRPGFFGNVVLLIGPDTVSAGETFTMAMLGREPHVTLIGLNTQGVFSDVLNRRLPNGWRFHLPNEVYFTAEQRAFDATGVPPDVRVNFFSLEDLSGARDAAIEEGQKLLLGRLGMGGGAYP